jgi:hypothetical protein
MGDTTTTETQRTQRLHREEDLRCLSRYINHGDCLGLRLLWKIGNDRLSAWPSSASNQDAVVKVEGCVSCHGQIEPMHKYGTTETLEKLKDGKDAVGLSCTACHGGNPFRSSKRKRT